MKKGRIHIVHDRQIRLANLRTFLSFLRTSLSCWGLGIALFHLINTELYRLLGLVCIGLGFLTFLWGVIEYYFVQKNYTRDIKEHDLQ